MQNLMALDHYVENNCIFLTPDSCLILARRASPHWGASQSLTFSLLLFHMFTTIFFLYAFFPSRFSISFSYLPLRISRHLRRLTLALFYNSLHGRAGNSSAPIGSTADTVIKASDEIFRER